MRLFLDELNQITQYLYCLMLYNDYDTYIEKDGKVFMPVKDYAGLEKQTLLNICANIISNLKLWYLEEKVQKKKQPFECTGEYSFPMNIENAKKLEIRMLKVLNNLFMKIKQDNIHKNILKQYKSILEYRKEIPL